MPIPQFFTSGGALVPVSESNPMPVTGGTGGAAGTVPGLEIPAHDYVELSYTGSNLTSIIYKTGGAAGTTVATLTLAYDGSDNLVSITKS